MKSTIGKFAHDLTSAFNPAEWVEVIKTLRRASPRTLLATFRKLLPQLLLYYLFLAPNVAAPVYNMLLFHPTLVSPFPVHRIAGISVENVFFASTDAKQLHAWYLQVPSSEHVVLISHGNGGSLTERIPLIAMFLRCGVSVLIYDYEGYGRSNGSPSLEHICEDGLAAYDWLHGQKTYQEKEIVVFGESLGTGVACYIAEHKNVAGIILQSAYSSLPALAQQKILWLRLYPIWLFPKL